MEYVKMYVFIILINRTIYQIFQEGIVIVDTPGVGENRQMTKLIEKYLSKSFGFIYIVNSSNAGGVQGGRVFIYFHTFCLIFSVFDFIVYTM